MVVGRAELWQVLLVPVLPDAFVINLDLSSTVSPTPSVQCGPALVLMVRPMDIDGKPLILTWDHVEAKIKQLCDMAKNGDERPSMVVIDTMIPMIRLLEPWAARQMGEGP
jgi:hypothetical protein